MSPEERALAYIQRIHSIEGQGGSDAAYHAACSAAEGFDLPDAALRAVLAQWNVTNAAPPWSERELAHKIEDAVKVRDRSGRRGYLLSKRPEAQRVRYRAVRAEGVAHCLGVERFLEEAFQPGEGVAVVACVKDERGRSIPRHRGTVIERDRLLGKIRADAAWLSTFLAAGGAGAYVRVNPMRERGSKDEDVTAYRHLLVEFDEGSEAEQRAILERSGAPVTCLIHSGGKSVHAWVRVDAANLEEYRERGRIIQELFPGADKKVGNPSRFSRLPGVSRNGSRQRLLKVRQGAESWGVWRRPPPAPAAPVWSNAGLFGWDAGQDPSCLLGRRWLCRGGSVLWAGQSGIGKSSLLAQAVYTWAAGKDFFGIAPARALRSVVVQAENDYGDCAEMVQGVARGLGLGLAEMREFDRTEAVVWKREVCKHGIEFANFLREACKRHRPDLLWIDPLMGYFDGEINSQADCARFFRTLLNPIADEYGVALMVVHHTPKPPKDPKARSGWGVHDYSYIGAGSAEITNWARAVAYLRPEKERYRLVLAKRGVRAGWPHASGGLLLRHGVSGIVWEADSAPERRETPRRTHYSKGWDVGLAGDVRAAARLHLPAAEGEL